MPTFAGTTNERGEVRFDGVERGKCHVEALPAAQTFPDLGKDEDPFPADKDLGGRMIIESQEVTITTGTETRVTMCARPARYVRGTLRPPEGRKPADYEIDCHCWQDLCGCRLHYNRKTGEFLLGPWTAGKHRVGLLRVDGVVSPDSFASQEVYVPDNPVVPIDITPAAEPGKDQTSHLLQRTWTGMGGVRGCSQWDRRIAAAASSSATAKHPPSLLSWPTSCPRTSRPVGVGTTDALGRLAIGGAWHLQVTDALGRIGFGGLMCFGDGPEKAPPGSPTVPVLVAWLPGSCGATITPIKDEADAKDLKIVLPPPLAASGKVTVGGKAIRGRRSLFRVVAEYEGQGSLAGVLSRSVTPEMDGRFELPALTPGTYRVQAAMDNIWLSPSVRLKVSAAAKMEPLTLDIGQPGPATTLRVVNPAGKPLPDVKATVARPEGPLADMLWPREFTSDGAGVLHIPPLEAGTHRLQVRGAAKERLLTVPPLADVNAVEVEPPVIVK